MKLGKLICFAIIAMQAWGQELLPIELDTTIQSKRISIQGSAFYLSSGVQNAVAKRLVYGGAIDEIAKNESLETHNEINRLGAEAHFRLQYFSDDQLIKNRPQYSWMVDVGYEAHLAAQYSKKAFGLLFFGNDQYLGETANLSNSFGQFQSFYTIGGGLHDLKTKSFISLNAILPLSDQRFDIDRGTLYTSVAADTVMLNFRGGARQSSSPAYFKGLGAAVNLDLNIPISTSGMTGFMSIKARNLGAYYLTEFTEINAEATTSFSGYSVEELISLTEDADNVLNDSLNVTRDTTSGWRMAPGFIQVGKVVEKYTDRHFQSFFGVRMYTNRIYKPLGYVGAHWAPNLNWCLGAQVSFGGYGNFRGGIYAGYTSEKVALSIGTEDLVGLFANGQYGQSALIRMSWNL